MRKGASRESHGAAVKERKGADAEKRKEVTQGYTRYMREFARKNMSLVSREDLQEILERYRAAAPSAAQSWKYRLEELCKMANADFTAEDLIADPMKLADVPNTEDRLTQMLYEMYQRFCSSDAYMTRLVRTCAPEFQADTVRVAILKQFMKGCWKGYTVDLVPSWRNTDNTDEDNDAYFKRLLSRQRNCQTIRIEGVIEWVVDQMTPENREAWLEKWLSAGAKDQLEGLFSQIDDSIFTRLDLTPAEELEAMLDVMDNQFTADPVAYYTEDTAGVKCAITDFCAKEETAEAIWQFMRENGFADADGFAYNFSGKVTDALRAVLAAGKTNSELREKIDQKPDFYERLQEDFKNQCRAIRRGPGRVPLSDAEYKAGLSEKSMKGRLTMMVKRMRTFMEGASNRTYCLWTDDHAEPITDLILDDETYTELQKFADANGVEAKGKRTVDYLNAIYEAKLQSRVLGQRDGEKEPVMDAIYRQYKEMRERIRQYPGTDTAQRKYRDSQDKTRKQVESADSGRKRNSRLWQEILGMCDSLANARFHLYGGDQDTIQSLYYFAFMFHMTSDLDDVPGDPDLDIERRLFQEYYADNLMIYLKEYNPKTDSSIEYEPSGAGINYKNYAETLYLFYLYQMNRQEQLLRAGKAVPDRDEPRTPGDWLDRAENMIARCAASAQRGHGRNTAVVRRPVDLHNTRWYREKAFGKEHILLSLTAKAEDEEKIVRFITENYQILSVGGIETPTSQSKQLITAAKNASELQLRMDEAEFDSYWLSEEEPEVSGVLTYLYSSDESSDPLTREEKKERKELLRTNFDWNIYADLLKKRYVYADIKEKIFYPDADKGFGRIIDRANDRLNRKFYGYRYEEMLRTCYLLRCFVFHGKEKGVFSKETIQSFSKRIDSVLLMGKYEIRKSAGLLKTLGFPVEIEMDADERTGGDRIRCEWIAPQMREFLSHPTTQGEAVRRLTEATYKDPRLEREERNQIKAVYKGIFDWYLYTYRQKRMEELLISKTQIARRAGKYIKMPKGSGEATARMIMVCLDVMQENGYFLPFPNETAAYLLRTVSQDDLKIQANENEPTPMENMIRAMRNLIVEKLDWPQTRSELLSVYADKYMRDLNVRAERADGGKMSLLQFYEDFRKGNESEPEERLGADELLQESRFQPISEKNFLDMYVVLSLYVYWMKIRSCSKSI